MLLPPSHVAVKRNFAFTCIASLLVRGGRSHGSVEESKKFLCLWIIAFILFVFEVLLDTAVQQSRKLLLS